MNGGSPGALATPANSTTIVTSPTTPVALIMRVQRSALVSINTVMTVRSLFVRLRGVGWRMPAPKRS